MIIANQHLSQILKNLQLLFQNSGLIQTLEGNVLEKFAYENSSGRNMAFFLDETKKLEKFHQTV